MPREIPKGLLPIGLSLMVGLSFTTIHSFIYNWVFLPRIFPEGESPFLINMSIIHQYWDWPVGKILIGINIIGLILPFMLIQIYSSNGKSRTESSSRS